MIFLQHFPCHFAAILPEFFLRQFFKQAKKMGVHPLDFMEKKVMNPSIPGAGSSKDMTAVGDTLW